MPVTAPDCAATGVVGDVEANGFDPASEDDCCAGKKGFKLGGDCTGGSSGAGGDDNAGAKGFGTGVAGEAGEKISLAILLLSDGEKASLVVDDDEEAVNPLVCTNGSLLPIPDWEKASLVVVDE